MDKRIAFDTNMLVSAVLSPNGAAREVMRRCLTGAARPLIGNTSFLEYEDVLEREESFAMSPISPEDRAALFDAVLGICQWIDVSFLWRPNLRDESDNRLVELAVAGNGAWIVTGTEKDFPAGELTFGGFRVVTPGALLLEDD